MLKTKKGQGIVIVIAIAVIVLVVGFIGYYIYSYATYGSKEGTIIDKSYTPAHTYTTTQTSYVNGSTINIPSQNYQAESYTFAIQKVINGKTKSIWVNVTKEEFEKYNIGDYFKR